MTNIPEKHSAVRAYTLKILQQRLGSTQTAISHASDKFYSNLWTNGEEIRAELRGGVSIPPGVKVLLIVVTLDNELHVNLDNQVFRALKRP